MSMEISVAERIMWIVGEYAVMKNKRYPGARKIIEVTPPGHLPSKDYPFRQGKAYTKETRPDPGFARLVLQHTETGNYSWPRCKDCWPLGSDPTAQPVKKPKEESKIHRHMYKAEALTLLCEDLIQLFHHSHMDEPLHEVQEVLQPYRERLHKIKGK